MRKLVLAILASFAIMYLVPFAVYGPLSMIAGLEPPSDGDPAAFMIGVAVSKVGTATVFVLIFNYARNVV